MPSTSTNGAQNAQPPGRRVLRITIKRLRLLIIALACLLIAVVGGFLVYARYRVRHIARDLPGRLGVNIQQTANVFTYSQSDKGHTTFTIHASKLVQFKSDHAILHDVVITLYGPPGSNRQDRISGSVFDYDQKNSIVTARGEVQIDLQSLQSDSGKPADEGSAADQNRIHVKAYGLVFDQKTGIATTDQSVEFQLPRAQGRSIGASFDSKQGLLVLYKQVEITSSANGEPAVVHAEHAQLLRDSHQAFLLHPKTDFRDTHSSSDQAIVYFRKDGSTERIDAKGSVRVVTDDGAQTTSQTADIYLDEKSQPMQALMGGGINFVSNGPTQSMHGNAVEGTLTFGNNNQLKHAQFRDAVSFVDQQLKLANDPNGSATRQMQSSKLDIDFALGPGNKSVAQKALATGDAVATLRTIPSKAKEENTTISGDQLLATLTDGRTIRQLDGSGHTKIVDSPQDGPTSVTTGDVLHMTFQPQDKTQAKSGTAVQASQIETAVQEGNVHLTQTPAKSAKQALPLRATANRAEYRSADQIVHLMGSPRINNGEVDLAAQTVDYHRDTGDATARGDIKATYLQQQNQSGNSHGTMMGGQGPVHIVSDEAELHHATNDSVFRGHARMWQQTGNIVAAPVIELSQAQQTLKAHGDGGNSQIVDTTIASMMGPNRHPGVVRVKSQTLFYTDKDRRGDFAGGVVAVSPNGTIRSDHAQFFLEPAQTKSSGGATSSSQSSQIQKIIATGRVVLTQPGRKGQGEQLVYTSADGRYVLTGTPANPPFVVDAVRGTTTGAALIFNDQDDSVEVSGGQSAAVTKTRAPK
ncbi:MAG TPA: LptA/OstA family protein [Pseudacidobacterium sp.]|jgi:lipopolysaccharide export system protein LptA|nr:LptA/OstA family protein [Pseudacidobacterium sp.]